MSRRIVLVTARFPTRSETFIVDKFLALRARGFDVHVLAGRPESADPFPELAGELADRVHTVDPRSLADLGWRAFADPIRLARSWAAIPRSRGLPPARGVVQALRLTGLAPDLVHVEFAWLAHGVVAAASSLGCATLVSFRGADANYIGLEQDGFYDEIWHHADALHCLGDDLWRRVQSRGCPPDMRHALIPPAVDANRFRPRDRPPHDGPLRVVSVGRLHWKKGHEYAVQAVDLVRRAGVPVELRIVGTGAFRPAVEAAITELGLTDHVTLTGPASRDDVRDTLQWADVFLHAAVSEGFANAVLEAQAMALPVVTTDADGLPANVVDGETGFVVARRDPAALADRLVELAGAPELRERLGRSGRRRVEDHFRPQDQIDAFVRLYDELMTG